MTSVTLTTLKEFSDHELISELRRRKRLREFTASRMYYTELKDADGYVEGITKNLAMLLGTQLLDVATVAEKPGAMPMSDTPVITRDVSVIVITPVITEATDEVAAEKV